jgi:hypothetical protein
MTLLSAGAGDIIGDLFGRLFGDGGGRTDYKDKKGI